MFRITERISQIAVLLLLSIVAAWAQPQSGMLERLLQIADQDQVQAFHQLKLSDQQTSKIRSILWSYVPQAKKFQAEPARLIPLVPEVWSKVEAELTPEQRPIARKLLPRPHQWAKLSEAYRGL